MEVQKTETESKNKAAAHLIAVWVLVAVLLIAVAVLGIVIAVQNRKSNDANQRLENFYQKNFFELTSTVEEMEVELSKLLVTSDRDMQTKLLNQVFKECLIAGGNLSNLPTGHETIKNTITFVNQLGGYSYTLAENLSSRSALITAETRGKFKELHEFCQEIKYDLFIISSKISVGGYTISKNLDGAMQGESSDFDRNFSDLKNISLDIPQLLYDGPYSESLSDKAIKGLPAGECTREEAQIYLSQIFAEEGIKKINYTGNTSADFNTYNFEIELNDGDTLFVQVARRGKFILLVERAGVGAGSGAGLTEAECYEKAEDFVVRLGLKDMKAIWASRSDDVIYINVAPVVNNVIYYPDLIKIKLSTRNGSILGYEAKSYAFNNVKRTLSTPKVTAATAREQVVDGFQVKSVRLVLIPKAYGTETLAYEIEGNYAGFSYYIYINAETGAEEDIFRVVALAGGNLMR